MLEFKGLRPLYYDGLFLCQILLTDETGHLDDAIRLAQLFDSQNPIGLIRALLCCRLIEIFMSRRFDRFAFLCFSLLEEYSALYLG